MNTVYALIDPRTDQYFYVGRTGNLTSRISKHKSKDANTGTPKYIYISEMRAAGVMFLVEVLEENLTKPESKFWERFYTDLFRSWGFEILNNVWYKFGNQTSFRVGDGNSPVVALDKQGNFIAEYASVKAAQIAVKKQIGQCLMKVRKTSAGFIWLYKDDYLNKSPREIQNIVGWATTANFHRNAGSFKKGQTPWNKKTNLEHVNKAA